MATWWDRNSATVAPAGWLAAAGLIGLGLAAGLGWQAQGVPSWFVAGALLGRLRDLRWGHLRAANQREVLACLNRVMERQVRVIRAEDEPLA